MLQLIWIIIVDPLVHFNIFDPTYSRKKENFRRISKGIRMEESLISRKLFVTAPGLDANDSEVLRERCEVYGIVEEVVYKIYLRKYHFIVLSSGDSP